MFDNQTKYFSISRKAHVVAQPWDSSSGVALRSHPAAEFVPKPRPCVSEDDGNAGESPYSSKSCFIEEPRAGTWAAKSNRSVALCSFWPFLFMQIDSDIFSPCFKERGLLTAPRDMRLVEAKSRDLTAAQRFLLT